MNFAATQQLRRSPFGREAMALGVWSALAVSACGGRATDVESESQISVGAASVPLDESLPPRSIVDDDGKQCPRAKFKTIQAALDAAKSGDTILVCAGKYREAPTVTNTVTLLGAQHGVDARTRKGNSASETLVITDGFDVAADKVVFDGFSLQAVFNESDDVAYGLFLHEEHSGYRVLNNLMSGSAGALFLGSSGAIPTSVMHNKFSGRGVFADSDEPRVHAHNERIQENWFDGAQLGFGGPGHSDLQILDNRLTNGATITLFDNFYPTGNPATRDVTVQGNSIDKPGNNPAILLRHIQSSELLDNTLEDGSSSGIAIVGSNSDLYLGSNTISGFSGSAIQVGQPPPDGVAQEQTTGLSVDANHLDHNGAGIALLFAQSDAFSQNTIQHSRLIGIAVDAHSAHNTFEANTVSASKQRDCQDQSVDGGTSHTANAWTRDIGGTSTPAGICMPQH